VYEHKTFENILAEMIANAPGGIDTRPGSIFYDAIAPVAMQLADAYVDLDATLELSQIENTSGEYLDEKAKDYGLEREPALPAKYSVTITSTETIPDGERFYAGGYYFILRTGEGSVRYMEAEEPGAAPNGVPEGTPLLPDNNFAGLEAISLGSLITPGEDEQTDESLRAACADKVGRPPENGNRYHYKQWCESRPGVGLAIVMPQVPSPLMVTAALVGSDGLPAGSQVVAAVQEYIDPNQNGDGSGVANCGAVFIAQAATALDIDVSFTVVPAVGSSLADVETEFDEAFTAMLKEIALAKEDPNEPGSPASVVRYSSIGSLIFGLPSVEDYSDLLVNEGTTNITLAPMEIPVKGVITIV